MSVRALIVDDEAPARRELERLLTSIPDVVVAGSLSVAAQVLPYLEEHPCDIALLDIRMPGLSGLELASRILARPEPPHIAFVTAHDEHALAAFEREALDYILKPPALDRLKRLVERVAARSTSLPPIEALARAIAPREVPLLIGSVPGTARKLLVRASEVCYVEASDELVFLVSATARTLAVQPLHELETLLAPHLFVRTHRSYIVNLAHVREIEPDREGTYRLKLDLSDARVPVSRRHWPTVRARLGLAG